MNKSFRRFLALTFLGIGWTAACTVTARADDTAKELAATVTRMTDWLAPSASAHQWRIYLNLNALETQVGHGYRADVQRLSSIHERFVQGAANRHRNFQAVTDALARHQQRVKAAAEQYPADQFHRDDLSAWSEAFRQAIPSLHPMSAESINQSRQEALAEVMVLDQFLKERGPLPLEALARPLAILLEDPEVSTEFDTAPLIEMLQEMVVLDWDSDGSAPASDITGMRRVLRTELDNLKRYAKQDPNPYVAYTLWKLEDYERKLFLGSRENLVDLLRPQVERLTESLTDWNPQGDRIRQIEMVRIVGLLESTDQMPVLLAAFKRTFWRNNASFHVSEKLVNRFASQPVQNTQPVDEVILDNRVLGTAYTSGQVEIDFVPSDSQAHFSLHLMGTVNSDNYSPVGPITVYTGSQAQIEARRSVYLNTGGWFEKAPYGSTNLASFFKGTSCGRLIESIAQQQFELQRDGAQQIAARRAERRMLNEFQRETTDALTNGRTQLQQRRANANVLKPYRPTAYVLTSEHYLHGYANRYGASQMSALIPPPAVNLAADVALQLHDSLVNNYLEDELGGLTITDQDLDRLESRQKESRAVKGTISDQQPGEVQQPDEVEPPQARDPFEVTLDNARPIDVHFADQMIYVTVNIRRFRSQGQSISDVQVKTRFKMHYDSENGVAGIRIEQLGEIDAALKDPDDISIDSATILNLIETTINRELQRQRTDQQEQGIWVPLNLIDRSKIAALDGIEGVEILDQVRLVLASFDNGWASLGWKLEEEGPVQYSLSDDMAPAAPPQSARLPAVASPEEFQAMEAAAAAETQPSPQ